MLILCMVVTMLPVTAITPRAAASTGTNLIANPGGELGTAEYGSIDLSKNGWIGSNRWYSYNSFNGNNPHSGTYFMACYNPFDNPGEISCYQDIDISSLSSNIDANKLIVTLSGWLRSTGGNTTRLQLQMLDQYGSPLSGVFEKTSTASSWGQVQLTEAVVPNARTLRVTMTASHIASGITALDDLSLVLTTNNGAPPVVSAIANQSAISGELLGPISFTASDSDTALSNLTVQASSSNQTLIPDNNIYPILVNGNGGIQVLPVNGETGQAEITVAVSDGVKTTRITFTVTVNPAITMGTNLVVNGDGSSTNGWNDERSRFLYDPAFVVSTVNLGESKYYMTQTINIGKFGQLVDAELLTYSTGCTLVSGGECIFQGVNEYNTVIWERSGAVSKLTIPAGTRKVIVKVGGPVNASIDNISFMIDTSTLPKMTAIADQIIESGASSITIPFLLAYPGTGFSYSITSSNENLVTYENISFWGSGYQRTITVTPKPSIGGSSVITVYVNGTKLESFQVTVPKLTPTVTLLVSPESPITYGNNLNLTATLSGGNLPTGTVQFKVNGANIGAPVTLSNGTALLSYVPEADEAPYTYSATYSGDGNNNSTTSNEVTHSVNKANQSALTITSSDTHTFGSTYHAEFSGGSTNGTVTYQITGGTGAGTFTGNELTVTKAGTIIYTATMAGNTNYNEVTSSALILTVTKATSTITINDDKTSTYNKTAVTYDASDVSISGSTGAVTFKYYSDIACTDEISAPVNAGTYYVKATLAADDNYTEATSTAAIITINPKPVTITGVTVNDKTYDGNPLASIKTAGAVNDVESGDIVTVNAGICFFNNVNANSSVGVTASNFALEGTNSGNYTLSSQPVVANARINIATLNVSVEKVTIKNGQLIPQLNVLVDGFVNGETPSTLPVYAKPMAFQSEPVDTMNQSLTQFAVVYIPGMVVPKNYDFVYTTTAQIEIQPVYVTDADYSVNKDLSKWHNENIIITPQNGYAQISTNMTDWSSNLVLDQEGENQVTIYLKKADRTITEGKTIHYKIDKTAPTGAISIKENIFRHTTNVLNFGIFSKNSALVSITSNDNLSNTDIQFMISDPVSEPTYQLYYGPFGLTQKSPYVVLAKITDEAGNETYIRTDGIIVYEDSTAVTDNVIYEKLSVEDKTATVNLNGNTIYSVLVGETRLAIDMYDIVDNTITLKGNYLETLPAGSYTATVNYNPQGYAYAPTNYDGTVTYFGDAPSNTTFTIDVVRKALTIDELVYQAPEHLVYDTTQKTATVTAAAGVTGIGDITVNYYSGDQKLSSAPTDVGSYTVKVDITEGTNYTAATALTVGTFTITNANQSAPTTPTAINTTTLANNDGQIDGVDASMEYQKLGDSQWTTITDAKVTGLSDGVYLVRYAAKANYSAGETKEVVIAKYLGTKEATPNATFNAITRTLSDTLAGEKYKINDGSWMDVTADLTDVVTDACLIHIYMPGDGIYSLDSDVLIIPVTKADMPTVTVENESFAGKNDGMITGVSSAMEYKAENGAWMDVTGNKIEKLVPGTYFIRVKATETVLESNATEIIIAAGNPEFNDKTIIEDTNDTSVSGKLTEGATLNVIPITDDDTNYQSIIKLIDTDKDIVLGSYEVTITNGKYEGELILSFYVGTQYNGKTMTIYHQKADGSVETFTALCKDGKVTITVDELSPFVITVVKEVEETPEPTETTNPSATPEPTDKPNPTDNPDSTETAEPTETPNDGDTPSTGDNSNIELWIGLLLASGFVLLCSVTYKKKQKPVK